MPDPYEKPPRPFVAFAEPAKTPRPLAEAIGLSKFSFAVPETVYGTACMCAILSPRKTLGEWFRDCGECYFRLLWNYVLQAFFLVGLYQLYNWQLDSIATQNCYTIQPYFFIICTWIFFAVVLTEMEETLALTHLVLQCVPSVPGRSQCLEYTVGEDGPSLVGGGMSKSRKVSVTLLVCLPKFVIAVILLIFGGNFLSSAGSNTDLLLNSLAVVFIIEIDELIYGFLTPPGTRRLISECPQFESNAPNNMFWLVWHRGAVYIKMVVSGVLVVYFYTTRPDCGVTTCGLAGTLEAFCGGE